MLVLLLTLLREVSGDDGVHLIQHSVVTSTESSLGLSSNWPPANWVTTPFGDCTRACAKPIETRLVECQSLRDGSALPAEACASWPKPGTYRFCSCDLEVCKNTTTANTTTDCGVLAHAIPTLPLATDFETIGCFHPAPEDTAISACPNVSITDYECMSWEGSTPCRSGLPFYRNCEAKDPLSCFHFCMKEGLDIFGFVGGSECRCGASVLNWQIWHQKPPPPGLLFTTRLATFNSENCPLLVGRYPGHYISGGLPLELRAMTLQDQSYVHSIVAHHRIEPDEEEDKIDLNASAKAVDNTSNTSNTSNASTTALAKANRTNEVDPQWTRSCWPSNCGPGRGPWSVRQTTAPSGVPNVYQEYVIVKYFFSAGLDSTRKEAFRSAVEAWYTSTCIVLIEEDPIQTANRIEVGTAATDSCYLSGMGEGSSFINLGWCNSMAERGNMIHEIGHALGMNHEQKRSDAQQSYHGHGPHLTIFWQNVPSSWEPQYLPDDSSYIGSAVDGPSDPHSGYAAYDFGSIMHYGASGRFDTIPASSKSLVGQRVALHAGDITQVLDQYQCIQKTIGQLVLSFGSTLLGTFRSLGSTLGGSPFFKYFVAKGRAQHGKSGDMWVYYDPHCDGLSTTAGRWIIGTVEPSTTQASDLDSDAACVYDGYVLSDVTTLPPLGSSTWQYNCQEPGGCQSVTVTTVASETAPTPAPPTPAPPTPAPPTPAPPTPAPPTPAPPTPAPAPAPAPAGGGSKAGVSTGGIVGIVVAVVMGIALVVGGVMACGGTSA